MALPIRDILAVQKSRATRFGHHGLIVIVKGHEELFFEFGHEDKRDSFALLLERQMDDLRRRLATGENTINSPGRREALILEEFERKDSTSSMELVPPENMMDSLPAVMFTSASSTFLTFKPSKPLHFTFLTIGSRGDVQPYIALAKGLMADGHKCRIATHGEFKEWIESVSSTIARTLRNPVTPLNFFLSMGLNSASLAAILRNLCAFVLKTAHLLFLSLRKVFRRFAARFLLSYRLI